MTDLLSCMVFQQLDNPVYYALSSGDADKSYGTAHARYFDDTVSPFAGFDIGLQQGFRELYDMLPAGRKILYASRELIQEPVGWKLLREIKGLQFVFDLPIAVEKNSKEPLLLDDGHIPEMVELARLTKPGPFDTGTIKFGYYYGFFEDNKLVAMTGQRLHLPDYTEISAVCTHPHHLGKGYAANLLRHQLNIIINHGKIPFLHVRDDNERAIALYERLGFRRNGPMNFYFMKRRD